MMRSYDLDTKAASQADEKSARISETGKYIGTMKEAFAIKSAQKGTEGIEIHFESDAKQETRIQIWTYKADGTPLSGNNLVNAIMTCVQSRSLRPAEKLIEAWDNVAKAKVKKTVPSFPELTGKRIGFLFQRAPEEYIKDGQVAVAEKLETYGVFDAKSELTASEIIGKKAAPEKLSRMVSGLKDRPLKKLQGNQQQYSGCQPSAPGFQSNDFEDDIPF